VFNINGVTDVFLEWGMGRTYRNEIDIWGELDSIYTDKIFSKLADYEPSYILTNKKGQKTTKTCRPTNHFVAMFDYFGEMVGDDTIINLEYERILRRASYLGELFEAGKKYLN